MAERRPGEVFNPIARRYDFLNSVLSLGRDQAWRRAVVRHLPEGSLLDLGAGTGAANPIFGTRRVTALDPSAAMLSHNALESRVVGVGEQLPFSDGSFDAVFSAYVFRNLDSVAVTLGEISRILRPGGKAGIVDLGRPRGRIKRRIHRAGTAVVLPAVGLLSGSPGAYRYLHRTLDMLPPPEEMYASGPLAPERIWRMGMMGFVYGAVLVRE